MELVLICILAILILMLTFLLMKSNKKNKEYELEVKKVNEKFKDVIDVEKEKEKIISQKESELKKIEENTKNEEKKLSALKKEIIDEKNKSVKLIDYREYLKAEINLLEEDQTLQEFGFYKPKYYYETSEEYKEKIDFINSKQKEMIKADKAAICTTEWAINGSKAAGAKQTKNTLKLMLRAFNGEADSAIAKVKYNNIRVMINRILKAHETINKLNVTNNSYISKEYLQLKLEELQLNYEMAEKVQEEKEEQRRIKEQMREEEKAQKEFEKAQAEALKEEERAKKALEKAEEKLKTVHGEQLNKLNQEIEKLKQALIEAEKNKERAKSMAEITKSGHVYVISNIGSFGENVYKIGMTRRLEPMDRVRELGDASVPFNFDVHAMIYSKNAPELENLLHKEFYDNRVNKINDRREFFKVNLQDIKKALEKHNIQAEFTMLAEAEQYRQTLALENENSQKKEKILEDINKINNEKDYIMSI